MMNCEQCQNELEDFLYGELESPRAKALRAHLRVCAACAAQQTALEREHQLFTQYYEQSALEPSDALWHSIQTEIRATGHETATANVAETSASWRQRLWVNSAWWRQATFATALVLVSVAATTLYFKWQAQPTTNPLLAQGGEPTLQASPTFTPSPSPEILPAPKTNAPRVARPLPQPKLNEAQALQNQLARAEREYQQAIKLLDRVIARQRDQLEPNVRRQYESSLALIDNSIAESRRALRGEPSNTDSSQFLLAAYARKLELMRDIAMQAGQ